MPTLEERFWTKVDRRGSDECWEWQAAVFSTSGYGQFRHGGSSTTAHRVAYILAKGEIPQRCVCHTCDNRLCVNPQHLFAGTQRDNMQDASRKGRPLGARGEQNHFAKLKATHIPFIRELTRRGMTYRELARSCDVHYRTIERVCRRKTWKHIE